MSDEQPFDGAFDRSNMVMTDVSNMAFVFMIDYNGVADMKAGDGISKSQAAVWLRQVADTLDSQGEQR